MTQYSHHNHARRMWAWLRSPLEMVGRVVLGEPAAIVTVRQLDRLWQLERREQLRMAERAGDEQSLEAEIAKARLSPDEAEAVARGGLPIASWPDEDFGSLGGDSDQK